jgi:hypothetical protein
VSSYLSRRNVFTFTAGSRRIWQGCEGTYSLPECRSRFMKHDVWLVIHPIVTSAICIYHSVWKKDDNDSQLSAADCVEWWRHLSAECGHSEFIYLSHVLWIQTGHRHMECCRPSNSTHEYKYRGQSSVVQLKNDVQLRTISQQLALPWHCLMSIRHVASQFRRKCSFLYVRKKSAQMFTKLANSQQFF